MLIILSFFSNSFHLINFPPSFPSSLFFLSIIHLLVAPLHSRFTVFSPPRVDLALLSSVMSCCSYHKVLGTSLWALMHLRKLKSAARNLSCSADACSFCSWLDIVCLFRPYAMRYIYRACIWISHFSLPSISLFVQFQAASDNIVPRTSSFHTNSIKYSKLNYWKISSFRKTCRSI